MSDSTKLYRVAANGKELGEMSVDEMLEATRAHTLPADAVYWQAGPDRWRPIARILQPQIDTTRAESRAAAVSRIPASPTIANWFQRAIFVIPAVVVGVLFLAFVLSVVIGRSGNSGPSPYSARRAAERFVEERLKAPGTAKFSGNSETQVMSAGDGTYNVIGWVDAQNNFGAQIRSPYFVKLRHRGGDKWHPEDVVIESR